jgi:S1-C subfamily serine protease
MVETEVVAGQHPARAVAIAVGPRSRMKGYLGVTFDGPWAESGSGEDRVIRFYQYPRIALVEAASPAERAGVIVGDTLLALNGADVREQEISFARLLVPNSRITMRVRREGNPRDLRITVGETPEYIVRRLTPTPRAPVAATVPPEPSEVARVGAYGGASRPRTPVAPQAQGFVYWFGNDALAGARLETITEGLARALKVDEGVLVIRTVPGSMAYGSGLREGDVVTHVGSVKVRTVAELQRRIAAASSDDVKLLIVRDRKRKEIRLRW